jgi:dipeptidyl aminopeptidase/acylaminoacyl peptidase
MRQPRLLAALLPLVLAAHPPTAPAQPRAATGGAPAAVAAADPFERQRLWKELNDLAFRERLGGAVVQRKGSYRADDGLTIPVYLFAPRDSARPRPVVVLVHGGIHGDFDAGHAREVAELVRRGWIVVAPEYRGSTGYGREHYAAIDYGGREVEDCVAALDWLGATVPWADTGRVAIFGWSHGGFIAAHAVLRYPSRFRAAVAHVPVADLPTRMRTHDAWYHELFIQQPAFGAPLHANPRPYIERSLPTHARRLAVPLLVHAADNDEDVFIAENRLLRDSMVAAGKDRAGLYRYREWRSPPGGHSFSRQNTPQGRASWRETVAFLARHLAERD